MDHKAVIILSEKETDRIKKYLDPERIDECLGEDETFVKTASFPDGIEIDVKCCGVQYREGEDNSAWCEAVLFKNGSEAACTGPEDDYFGEWEFDYKGDHYSVTVSDSAA